VIRLVVVDDQAVIRTGLRTMLEHEGDITIVGEAGNGAEAVDVVGRARPDVVLMDVRMPDVDGIEATRRILAAEASPPAVLVLTTFDDDEYVFGALQAGAAGFLLKDAGPDVLAAAVRTVAAGDALVDPSVTRRLVERWAALESSAPAARPVPAAVETLSAREREILVGLARGRTNRELADDLIVSEATVKTHVSNLLTKLGVRSRVQAVVVAYESGVVRPGEGDPSKG
jgi:DNA-binding NarL/FixJ family response regulator